MAPATKLTRSPPPKRLSTGDVPSGLPRAVQYGIVVVGGTTVLQPCDPDATIWLLRQALLEKPEDVNLEVVFELVAQLVTDLRGWSSPPKLS